MAEKEIYYKATHAKYSFLSYRFIKKSEKNHNNTIDWSIKYYRIGCVHIKYFFLSFSWKLSLKENAIDFELTDEKEIFYGNQIGKMGPD